MKGFRGIIGLTILWALLLASASLSAQDTKVKLFKARDFGQYALADRYAPIVNLGLGFMEAMPDYDIDPNRRNIVRVAEPTLGTQIPLLYCSDGTRRISLSTPISFSVWFDYTEERTSPVLNADYRIGFAELNYSKSIQNTRIRSIGFRFIPVFHESTHIGDELLLEKTKDSIPLTRINVSYETIELSLILNDPYDELIRNHSLRIGAKALWRPKDGYYWVDSLENTSGVVIESSKRWLEANLQYQYQNPESRLSNKRMMFLLSTDLALRVRYGYSYKILNTDGDLATKQMGEGYQFCLNTMAGWKFINSNDEWTGLGLFLHFYYGINPHGQFRNIPAYPWLGLNLTYEL